VAREAIPPEVRAIHVEWGAKIRAHRLALKLSPTQLAGRVGISVTQLYRIEGGECAPTDDNRIALARELGLRVEELFAYPANHPSARAAS
jgi:transcriptional regulator with XRE-family HTH domain